MATSSKNSSSKNSSSKNSTGKATVVAVADQAESKSANKAAGKAASKAAAVAPSPIAAMAVGASVDTVLLLERKDIRPSRGESPFLFVELSDSSGQIVGVQFDYAPGADETVVGEPVRVGGVVEVFRGQRRLKIRSLAPERGADPRALIARTRIPVAELSQRVATVINAIPDRQVREAVKRVLRDGGLYARFREAPLSATGYGAWIGGAVEHTLSVVALASAACDAHPEIDRSSVIAAALLHQIGCVDAFEWDPAIVMLGRARRIPRGVLSSYRLQGGFGDGSHRSEALDRIEDLVVGSSAGVLSAEAPRGESLEHVVLLGAIEMAYAVGRRVAQTTAATASGQRARAAAVGAGIAGMRQVG